MAMRLVNCKRCRRQITLPPSAGNKRFVCRRCGQINNVSAPINAPPVIRVSGNKRAVLVGVSYKGTPFQLDGCANDVAFIRYLLSSKFNFPNDNIFTLTEDERDSRKIPTKRNILRALTWLVQGCSPGDSLVFHFSGHGLQKPDLKGEEFDGYDETLLPVDFRYNGVIVDNQLNALLVRPLPPGVRLHALVDACHSGTVLDLPYVCLLNGDGKAMWEDHSPPNGAFKGTQGGEAISLTSCADEQTTLDTNSLSKAKVYSGAMTRAFVSAIEAGEATTYGDLLRAMSKSVRQSRDKSTSAGGPVVFQEPQLCASYPFDIDDKPFHL
eukprot:TRINITY_DN3487_c0_g1_i3.p1 TRINITY_DN3487_c0_g1~~TRINITY_DN3487_c0_g1_i3.p1  ORF type:complete len:336 (-),score=-14.25 TRINITY_DN3487_c0_g1_i3:77-1051(-)